MSDLERLLVLGCTEMPACRCGKEMRIDRTYSDPRKTDTHIRVYKCPECGHEMRLTVWGSDELARVA
jgi:DNA-directed RNA polymerase subunit RPC12/RpoP